jgi:hypothetical protein
MNGLTCRPILEGEDDDRQRIVTSVSLEVVE